MRIPTLCKRVVYNSLLLLGSCGLSIVSAQNLSSLNTLLTTNNGLPNNAVTGVEQDRAGFIWIATHDGLARYDGRTVKTFRNRPGDSTSLADNKILELEPIADGTFIVTTESGSFQRFNPITERFTMLLDERYLARKKAAVTQVQLSADGRHLWGLMPSVRFVDYDLHQKTLTVYDIPTLSGTADYLRDFILTPSGYIYGMGQGGLFQFNTKTGGKRLIPFPFRKIDKRQWMSFWPINRHQVTQGPNGQIVIFGYEVLAIYDPVRDQFRTLPIPDVVKPSATHARMVATVISFALKTMADKHLYFGYMDRIYRLDEHDRFTLLHQPGGSVNKIAPWLLDRSGGLWTSGASAGLNRLDVQALPFGFSPLRKSFSEDLLEQDLHVTLPDSFEVWDNDHWPRYTLYKDKTGYLVDPSHLYRHVPNRHTLTELTALRLTQEKACCKLCMKLSRQGRIWFYNNYKGLVEVASGGEAGVLYPNSQVPLMGRKAGYDVSDIQPIGRSVWVGSQMGAGLLRYDIDQKRYDPPLRHNLQDPNSLSGTNINCLSADPTDSTVLWIGTAGGGLCRLNTRTMSFRRLSDSEGFPDRTIKSIETDTQGRLWCATNQGLVRVNPRTFTWRHFTTDDGLADNAFLQTSSARLPDGRLVFGTLKGRVIFDPGAIRDNGFEPPIVLTSLLINNKPVEANGPNGGRNARSGVSAESPLPAPLNTLTELVLDHTQNFLTIAFAGLDYGKAAKLNYRYKLADVDADWVMVGRQNTANYTQLAPGRYLFSVNSTTADGRWSRQVKRLGIVITPPFWATWWSYTLYALGFGGLVLGFIRFRTDQIRQRQEIRLKQQEAEQLRAVDEVKTRFFSNITHEFRTPLTLILSPTEKLLSEPGHNSPTRQTLGAIHQNAEKLLRLINQLLDVTKLEGGSMEISLGRGDAVDFVQHLAESFLPAAASRGIALTIDTDVPTSHNVDGPWLFDADKWEKILTNLLGNALKFTPTGGQIVLTIEPPTVNQVVLKLSDTGIGISPQHLPHIFDRFYQADTSRTRAYEGTGIGLALVKELTNLLGGTIAVSSQTDDPTGTTFTLTLPLLPVSTQPAAPTIRRPKAPSLVDESHYPTVNSLHSSVAVDAPLLLVVDDNEELRVFVAGELASRYRVLTAADGEDGWAICQRELPDVVLADVMMPRLDGFQLTNRIKSTLATNHVAVMLLTAKAAHTSRIEGLQQGADDYLTKPFHVDELFMRLDNMLTHRANLRAHLYRQLSISPGVTDEPLDDSFVCQLHLALEGRLDDSTFGVEDLAQAVAMSRRTLHRKLISVTGLAANDFIRHYRLQRATQFLQRGHSISETAYQVGFESPAYFSKVFKQTYHQTPSEYLNHPRA